MDTIFGFSAIAIAVGLTELVKRVGVSNRYAPIASLVFGVALAFLANGISGATVVSGIFFGLSASGLWSGVKSVSGK